MTEVLTSLTGRERFVLRSRFGLDDGRSRTLREVGIKLGMEVRGKAYSEGRVRQIEAKALSKLRHPSRSPRLEYFLA